MTKQVGTKTNSAKKKTHSSNVKTGFKKRSKKVLIDLSSSRFVHRKKEVTFVVIFFIAVLLIVSSYAWFSTSLNVKIKNFNMVVSRNSGLSISFDGINFDKIIEISEQTLIGDLVRTYPNNNSQWAKSGLRPVSSNGIANNNNSQFNVYTSSGVRYKDKKKEKGLITTKLNREERRTNGNNYLAFDLFFKNVTGSPVPDSLYLDVGTEVKMEGEATPEMEGLLNSIRIGFVKIGSTALTSSTNTIQNLTCNNKCASVIYEPNSTNHSELSIERAQKYSITLKDGEKFPTYACIKDGGPINVSDTVSGSANLDLNYFALQKTMTDSEFNDPLFTVPDGITKVRAYVWIEGQDIDSLETDSDGADISITINFIKDTQGYDRFN